MASEGPARIALAGEDEAHRVLATRLVDEAILAGADLAPWPERDQLEQARVWQGRTEAESMFDSKRLDGAFREVFPGRFMRTNRIDGAPAKEAAWFIDLYSFLVAAPEREPAGVIVLRDTDGDPALATHARRASDYVANSLQGPPAVFGLCHPEAEAWFVSRLADSPHRDSVTRALSFDPVAQPTRLSSSPDSPAEAKRVLARLVGEDVDLADLAERLFRDVPVPKLDASCGLRPFVEAVRGAIVPLVVPGPPR